MPVSFLISVNDTSPFVGDGVRVTATFNREVAGSVQFLSNGQNLNSAPVTVNGLVCSYNFVVTGLAVMDLTAVATLN